MVARVVRVGDGVEDLGQVFGSDRAAVAQARMDARGRLHAVGHPAVEADQARAQEPRIVDDATQVLGVVDGAGRIGGADLPVRGRPRAEAVLGARVVIDARVRAVRDVAHAVSARVDQRGVAAVVFGGGVRVHDLERAPPRVEPAMQGVRLARLRILLRHIREGKEVSHHLRAVLRVLAEALVELAPQTARHIGDDAVQRLAALLVEVEVVVDVGAEEPPRL
ncbi:MAG: hypothetical protein DME16_08635 [Candidatus Rokuibacteriota bacterium]|nr:MAG: hypothetical protein DME16_08635 [Candidatus Rokubacteria bacterium]